MKLKLKRDETSSSHPDVSQVDVGELIMNSVTGKLYTKLVDGTIIEFVGQKICYGSLPNITFDNSSNFCCYGDILSVHIDNLLPHPKNYTFEFEELTGDLSTISVRDPVYTPYSISNTESIPPGQVVNLRQCDIPIKININGSNSQENINIFKFSIYSDNIKITEKILPITCSVCN
jgi:hypothetical protein